MALLAWVVACTGKTPTPSTTPIEATTPAKATTDDEVNARLEWLATRLEEARVENHIPGMALAVVKDDEVIFARGFGLADLETQRKASPETLFAIGSTTKAFTSTLVAMQVDAGALAWDDPVTKYVPQMKLQPRSPQADGEMPKPTLRDVLCHRTGFTRMSLLWASGALPLADVLAKASGAEPISDFRDAFHYNNVTYASAGEAAARSANTTWSTMLQEQLLDPLGMEHTNVTLAAAMAESERAQGYRWREVSEVHEALPMRSLDSIAPAGAINSNVLDMSKWLRLQLGRGTFEGEALVSSARIEETWSPQISIGSGLEYGLGWMIGDWQGHRMVEHGGNIDGYAAEVGMLPDDGIGFVLLTNISVTPLQRGSLGIVFDSLLGEIPGEADEGTTIDLSPYPGKYVADFGPFDDARFTITAEGGTLYVDVPSQTKYELEAPDAEGRWAFAITDTIKVYFDLDDTTKRAQVLHMLQGGLDLELPRQGFTPPPEVEVAEVADLLGRYEAKEGKLGATVRVEKGRLIADIEGQMAFALRKPGDDGRWHFRAKDSIAVSFRREKGGKVEALVVHEGADNKDLLRIAGTAKAPPTVEQLLKRGKAKAFTKRLTKLGAVEITGTVRIPGSAVEGSFRMVFDAEGRQRMDVDFGVYGKLIETYDGTEAWSISTLGPPTRAEGKYLRQARFSSPFVAGDWRRGADEARVEGFVEREGKTLVEVTLRAKDLPPMTLLLDPKSGEVRATKQFTLAEGMGAIPNKGELSDYRRVLGLNLPHRVSTTNVHSGPTILKVEAVKKFEGDRATFFARQEI